MGIMYLCRCMCVRLVSCIIDFPHLPYPTTTACRTALHPSDLLWDCGLMRFVAFSIVHSPATILIASSVASLVSAPSPTSRILLRDQLFGLIQFLSYFLPWTPPKPVCIHSCGVTEAYLTATSQ